VPNKRARSATLTPPVICTISNNKYYSENFRLPARFFPVDVSLRES